MSGSPTPHGDIRRLGPSLPRHILRLEKEWGNLQDAYAGLSEDEMRQEGVAGEWSIKDILAHISIWEEESLLHLPIVAKGMRLPRYLAQGGIDAFNARAYAVHHHLTLRVVQSRLEDTHARLVSYLEVTPIAEMATKERFLHRLRLDTWSHYHLHAEGIREWRTSRPV